RGYCFVASVSRPVAGQDAPRAQEGWVPNVNLPSRPPSIIGRSDDVCRVSAQLTAVRLVTIVGTGGVGKTTVAVAVAHGLMDAFAGAVLFVDLAVVRSSDLLAPTVAAMFGLSVQTDDLTPGIIAYLRCRRILLILDTCEHLVTAVADLAAN